MSIKYSVAELKNPQRPEEPAKFYAKAQAREEVSLNRIADEIAYASSLTDGDVLNVLRGLIKKLKEHLADGDMVSLGDFGKFQCLVSSDGASSYDDFTYNQIKKVRIRFRPGSLLKEMIAGLGFEQVISVKARKEAARQMKQDAQGQTQP